MAVIAIDTSADAIEYFFNQRKPKSVAFGFMRTVALIEFIVHMRFIRNVYTAALVGYRYDDSAVFFR